MQTGVSQRVPTGAAPHIHQENYGEPATTGNLIIKSSEPIFNYLMNLKEKLELGEVFSPEVIRKDAIKLIAAAEKELLKNPNFHTRLDIIKYVLTALIDEVIIFSPWKYAQEWQVNPIEMELFGKSIAGEKFFELLESDGYRDPELAELFYNCLAIGFNRKIVREREYKQRLYALISDRIPEDERRLSPGAAETIIREDSRLPPLFGILAITTVLVVSALVYAISSQFLWSEASEFIHNVSIILNKGN